MDCKLVENVRHVTLDRCMLFTVIIYSASAVDCRRYTHGVALRRRDLVLDGRLLSQDVIQPACLASAVNRYGKDERMRAVALFNRCC